MNPRRVLLSILLATALALGGLGINAPVAPAATWVEQENAKPGTRDWVIPAGELAPADELAGYATQTSVTSGQDVVLRIDSPRSRRNRVSAFRLGWYGGTGGRLVDQTPWFTATPQSPATFIETNPDGLLINMVDASHWEDTITLTTTDWPEGVYLLIIENERGARSPIPFVVRSASFAGRTVMVSAPSTWQAYNMYGGYSAYRGTNPFGGTTGTLRSREISFNRPLDPATGVDHFMVMERAGVVEAERTGVNLAYTTNVDIAHDGATAYAGAAALISLGHDEYWDNPQEQAFRTLRNGGTNLIFAGGNTLWWRIRYLDAHRRYEIFKDAAEDPATVATEKTVNFSDSVTLGLLGARYSCYAVEAPLVVTDPAFFLFQGTGAVRGSQYPGLLREEVDSAYDIWASPANLSVAAHSPFQCQPNGGTSLFADFTYYSVASGAGVVNMASMGFIMAMDELNQHRRPFPQQSIDFARTVFSNAVRQASMGPLGLRHRPSGNALEVLSGHYAAPVDYDLDQTVPVPGSGVFGDLTRDRLADVVAVQKDTGALLLYTTGTGPALTGPDQVGTGWARMTWLALVPDLNGDGHTELAARRDDGTLWLYPGSSVGWRTPTRIGTGWDGMATLTVTPDVTGDRLPDLFGRQADGRLIRYSFTSLTTGLSRAAVVGKNWQSMTTLVAVDDLSGDRYPDLMAVRNDGALMLYTTRGGVLTWVKQVGRGWQGFTHILSPGDMNGDGRHDLLGVRADGNLYFYANTGTGWGYPRPIGRNWTGISLLA
ncbi:N,N-dimethylformamidase beta subunit family domain-containing protein [Propionibacteriaceae bacterium G1746]|uniref:N,N-dimethylformamidase beta subunit family domain-containing protein n=1 Tax=Aestuariimicrobium sp. G57 TaxID=3418485 RepID=UPI003C16CAE1